MQQLIFKNYHNSTAKIKLQEKLRNLFSHPQFRSVLKVSIYEHFAPNRGNRKKFARNITSLYAGE